MNLQTLQTTLRKVEQRLERLEKTIKAPMLSNQALVRDRHLTQSLQVDRERRLRILQKTAGVWNQLKLDPVAWQKKIRKQWCNRLKRQA